MTGQEMYKLAEELYSLNRSLTGHGTRVTLGIIGRELSGMKTCSVPSGTKCFDWTVPDEWNVIEAYIEGPDGKRVVDVANHILHIVGYSHAFNAVLSLEDLQAHLHSRPDMPDVIPYVTSYYKRDWGFCLTENQRKQLKPGDYHVVIDAMLKPGNMHYGELIIPGETTDEVLLSTYICHPSMANDGLSGIAVTTALAKWIAEKPRRYTYRILFVPETIGAIYYLSQHSEEMKRKTIAGFVLTMCGDAHDYSIVHSPSASTLADRVGIIAIEETDPDHEKISYGYEHRGSDERQYCWPGIDLPVVLMARSWHHTYPQYHTSADDMSAISPAGLEGGFNVVRQCLEIIEGNRFYAATTLCEPFMEGRGGYDADYKLATYCDGDTDALKIAGLTGRPFAEVAAGLAKMEQAGVVI